MGMKYVEIENKTIVVDNIQKIERAGDGGCCLLIIDGFAFYFGSVEERDAKYNEIIAKMQEL